MQFRSVLASLMCVLFASVSWSASQSSHPHFDDHGTLAWSQHLADAQAKARAADKLILIEYGRTECGSCRAMVQNILPDPRIRARVADLCVGLAAACDPPEEERAVANLMDEHLAGARSLPFVAFVTPDLRWVAGFSGWRGVADFDAVLAAVERSPLVQAAPDVARRLDAIADDAARALERSDLHAVVVASRAAAEVRGRSPARARIAQSVASARGAARDAISRQAEAIRKGGDREAARTALSRIGADFAGEDEGADADRGVRALERLGRIDALPVDRRAAARESAAREFDGSVWAGWFRPAAG